MINKVNTILIGLLALMLLMAAGCTKTNSSVFSWSYQGFNYVADSAYSPASASPNTIISAYSGYSIIEMSSANKLVVGSYHLAGVNTSAYMFYISNVSSPVYSQSGTLNVTYNDNTKMSGNFGATLQDGTYISGSFSDMPIR